MDWEARGDESGLLPATCCCCGVSEGLAADSAS